MLVIQKKMFVLLFTNICWYIECWSYYYRFLFNGISTIMGYLMWTIFVVYKVD